MADKASHVNELGDAPQAREIVGARIENLRSRLLDLTARNRLLSLRHTDKARGYVRIIDELPDVLFERLSKNGQMTFKPLPPIKDVPPDEKSDEFKVAVAEARLTDKTYLDALDNLDPEKDNTDDEEKIDRELKDRVRGLLGLPPRPTDKTSQSLVNHAKTHGLNPSYDLPHSDFDDIAVNMGWQDKTIQTLLLDEMLDRKMRGVVDLTRSAFQESGINTLFAAFGFIEWRESDSSEVSRFAPLILLPVEIKRTLRSHKYVFDVQGADDDPSINRALQMALQRLHGLDLPELDAGEQPESYFRKLSKILEAKPKWKVRRWITFGVFPFSRMAMYYDLDPERWSGADGIAAEGAVSDLIYGDGESLANLSFAEEYDVDNPEIERIAPLLITDADSSQHSAVIDVMQGKNLAIKGPPGTGKSQTIANIIANILASGKTVLFVAEKMAALEVVARRLEKFGLSDYYLELHSQKTRRADVLKAFERRRQSRAPALPSQLDDDIRELKSLRTKLANYVRVVNKPYGKTGKTVQETLWAEQRTRDDHRNMPQGLGGKRIEDPSEITPHELTHRKEILERVERAAGDIEKAFTYVNNHPWRGVGQFFATPNEEQQVVEVFSDWLGRTKAMLSLVERMRDEFGLSPERNLAAIRAFLAKAVQIPEAETCPNLSLASHLADLDARNCIERYREDCLGLITEMRGYNLHFEDPFKVDPKDIRKISKGWHDCGLDALTPQDIEKTVRERLDEAETLERMLPDFRRLSEIVQFETELSPAAIVVFTDLVRFITTCKREVFLRRNPAILDDRAPTVIEEAGKRAESLIVIKMDLDKRFSIDNDLAARDLKAHAKELRGAGLFSLFSGEIKAAKRTWRLLCLEGRKSKPHEIAAELNEIADYLESRADFLANETIRTLAGPDYRGIETDFDGLGQVCKILALSRETFARPDTLHSIARKLVAEGDMVVIDASISFATDPAFERIRTSLEKLGPDDRRPIAQVIDDHRANAAIAIDLAATARQAGFLSNGPLNIKATEIENLEGLLEKHSRLGTDSLAERVFGKAFGGVFTDFSHLPRCIDFVGAVVELELPEEFEERLFTSEHAIDDIKNWAQRIKETLDAFSSARQIVSSTALLDEEYFCGSENFEAVDLRQICIRLLEAIDGRESLASWGIYLRARNRADSAGIDFICQAFLDADMTFRNLPQAYERVFISSCSQHIYGIWSPDLANYSGVSHEQNHHRFQELDRKTLELNRSKVAAEAASHEVPTGVGSGLKRDYTNLALIQNEIRKRRGHIPVRQLIKRAGAAMMALKPCFMMSPNSVAQYIPPGVLKFDVVVIDEASQMRPEESLGAIARADQAVIVGDEMQLPPTSFFMREQDEDPDGIDAEEAVQEESILDLALGCFRPARDLRWHYRSRHESLIAFSNNQFYDDRLQLFPSPSEVRPDFGVRCHYIEEAAYKSGLNRKEADTVVKAAIDFMKDYPDRSLGISTMNHKQREYILEEIDRVATQDDDVAAYVARWESELESFFVKNLENVQGDERDVIYVSTVYGPDAESGKVNQRFGPINSAVGHRRLNVLFTRARENLVLFTSLRANDVRITESSSRGARALRAYLEYAETGRLAGGTETSREPDSDFEIFVMDRLESIGCEVVPQVGVHGYFIDLGVKHPRFPHGFLLGIECDGATYHSARSARDRDRLRQEVLESLGWDIYRIWSTDWFRDPNSEFARLKTYIELVLTQKGTQYPDGDRAETKSSEIEIPETSEKNEMQVSLTAPIQELGAEDVGPQHETSDTDLLYVGPVDEEVATSLPQSASPMIEVDSEAVEVGDRVLIAYNDDTSRKHTIRISATEHNPEMEIIKVGHPMAEALLGAVIDEELEISAGDGKRIVTVVGIEKDASKRQFQESPTHELNSGATTEENEGGNDTVVLPAQRETVTPSASEASVFSPEVPERLKHALKATPREETGWAEENPTARGESQGPLLHGAHSYSTQIYQAWNQHPLPDPRGEPVHKIADRLVEIIEAEGPVILHRAFHLYTDSAGIKRIGNQLRSTFLQATSIALKSGRIEAEEIVDGEGLGLESVVRPFGSPSVVPRRRGPRNFEEIPLSEMAEMMLRLFKTHPNADEESLFRWVLDFYDLKRLTSKVRNALSKNLSKIRRELPDGSHGA